MLAHLMLFGHLKNNDWNWELCPSADALCLLHYLPIATLSMCCDIPIFAVFLTGLGYSNHRYFDVSSLVPY